MIAIHINGDPTNHPPSLIRPRSIITMRILSLLAISVAICCACAAPPAVAPVADPEPAPALPDTVPAAPSGSAVAATGEPIAICVYKDGRITTIAATYDPATGDTLVGGRPFAEAHPVTSPPYAGAAEWFVRNEIVVVGSGPYSGKVKYGVPRTIAPELLQQVGEHRGVPMFAEAGTTGTPDVVYFLIRPGCVFHAYQVDYTVGEVRG